MLNFFGVEVVHRYIVNWRRGAWYMCILLCVKLIWCSGIPNIYCQLGGTSALSICAVCYMWNVFGVVVFHTSMVNWSWGWGTSALSMCAFCYMFNLCGVVVFHRSIVNGGGSLGICAFCYMWNFFGVAVFHTSMVNWREYICPQYMCILLYVKPIWCSGVL